MFTFRLHSLEEFNFLAVSRELHDGLLPGRRPALRVLALPDLAQLVHGVDFLHPRAVSVLLVKPIPRWGLLLGKYMGVLAFVLAQSTIFVMGTWLALGMRTHVWDASYLRAIPLLLLHFAIFFSASLLLATVTRSTVLCVFGSIAFWILCWAVNFGHHAVSAASQIAAEGSFSPITSRLTAVSYWILPKPVDLGQLAFNALGAEANFRPLVENSVAWPSLSILTSLLFMVYLLFAAGQQFAQTDY